MRILDKSNSVNEIMDLVLNKARYQKVVLCLDESSDMDYIEKIKNKFNKNAVVLTYYYNKGNVNSFYNMIDNGARVVIYNVSCEHFYKLQNNNPYLLNVFISQSNFLLPYISNTESMYGDNLLVCNTALKDYTTLLIVYELAFYNIWNLLLQGVEVDTKIFKNIDAIANGKVDFYYGLLNQMAILKGDLYKDYQQVEENQLPYYVYLRLFLIFQMLESLINDTEQYVDFYKTELSVADIEKAYTLLIKCNIIEILKCNAVNMIRINGAILNRIKIIIKKYFNFKNIKLNNLNKIIKNQSKILNIENLLYISYIFNLIK